MRILAVADAEHPSLYSHFDPERWRGVELLLGCGDLAADYLDFLATSLGVPFLYVRGNHDRELWRHRASVGDDIDGRIVTYKGLRILGFEGSAWYGGRGVEYSQRAMYWRVWSTFPRLLLAGRIDIVVSHAPPALAPGTPWGLPGDLPLAMQAGTTDSAEEVEGPSDLAHRGFRAFNDVISYFHPRLWLHGHTHLNYSRAPRVRRAGGTVVANAYQYVLFDL